MRQQVGASVGISLFPFDAASFESAHRKTDWQTLTEAEFKARVSSGTGYTQPVSASAFSTPRRAVSFPRIRRLI